MSWSGAGDRPSHRGRGEGCTLRVMTYNILNGGQDAMDFSRLNHVIEVVREADPDLLVVQEAKHFDLDGDRYLYRFENETGLRGFIARAQSGQHVVIFVRRSALVTEFHTVSKMFHHAMACLRVRLDDDRSLTVIGTHLCPHGGHNRLGEAQYLGRYARSTDLVLLLGDLNSLDGQNDYAEALGRLEARYRIRYVLPGTEQEVDDRVIRTLQAAGFLDLYRLSNPHSFGSTAPTRLGGSEFLDMRVDYAFGTKLVAEVTRACNVLISPSADKASDHYPLIADLNLKLRCV